MFIKTTKSKNYTYVQIAESYRDNDKVKHRILHNLGRLDLLRQNGLAEKLGKFLLGISDNRDIAAEMIKETSRLYYGHLIYFKLWEKLKLPSLLSSMIKNRKIEFNFSGTIFYLIINRLLNASSKKKAYELRNDYFGLNCNIELQHIYRSLDLLSKSKEQIERALFEKQKNLFNMKLDVVFYDVTTFHFESQQADEFKNFGFSKANKINEVQVVLGLLINHQGRPIGYELFEGNTFDGSTLVKALDILNKRFQLKKVIIVADKAMHSKENLHLIKLAGYDYIVSSRIKNASKKIKQEILSRKGFIDCIDEETGEITYSYKDIENSFVYLDDQTKQKYKYQDQLMVSWSSKRSKLDLKKRDRLWQRAENQLTKGKKTIGSKKGAARYLKTEEKCNVSGMDKEKYDKDAMWDGFYAVQYSGSKLSHKQVMEQYHQLWKIEQSFRVLKTTMKTRPIFHWTPERIKGHFMLCFISFLIERTLELKLNANQLKYSPEKIKEALNSLQVSELDINGESYCLKSAAKPEANKIMRVMKIPPLKNITAVENMPKIEF